MGSHPVLLGFMDVAMGEGEGHYSVNKIGGSPDWAGQGPSSFPQCGVCSQALVQVCQVYAPLSASAYHRTLHLLACPQPPCWNQQASWRCIRSQLKEPEQVNPDELTEAAQGKVTDWLGDADDWGEDEGDGFGDPNGNPVPGCWNPPGIPSTPSTPSPVGATGSQNNFNIDSLSLAHLNLASGDGNANEQERREEDSKGARGGIAAQAEVEQDDDDGDCCVAMEELEKPETDIPSLFFAANRPINNSELKIAAHYLWVGEEKESDIKREETKKDEERLLQEYKAREALETAMGQGGRGGGGGVKGGEGWEKVIPTHGDELLHKMVEVIQKNPGQVLRYTRQCGVPPLLLQPIHEIRLPCCRLCGSSTTFELQLLPSLVAQLRVEGGREEGPPVEFGTVLIFSCLASCWGEGEPREETVIVQAETM